MARRELSARQIDVVGLDVTAQLIEEARQTGGAEFRVISYEDLAAERFKTSLDARFLTSRRWGKNRRQPLSRDLGTSGGAHNRSRLWHNILSSPPSPLGPDNLRLLLRATKVCLLNLGDLLIIERDRSTAVPLFADEVKSRRRLMTT